MTRFARARGSKASNEKTPEDGTPWEVMKEQLERAKIDSEQAKKRHAAEQQRIDNYEKFLKDHKTLKRQATWCDFPEEQQEQKKSAKSDKNSNNSVNKKKKKKLKLNTEAKISEPGIESAKNKNKVITENHVETTTSNSDTQISTPEKSKKKNKKKKEFSESATEAEPPSDMVNNNEVPLTKTDNDKKLKKKNKNPISNQEKQENCVVNIYTKNDKKGMKSQNEFNKNKTQTSKMKKNKKFVDGQPARRKPVNDNSFRLMINGKDVKLVRLDGFPIMQKDAERIEELRKSMLQKGIPKSEIQRTIKLERRRAEKALARMKKDVCYNCRKGGHNLSDCPDLKSKIPGVDSASDGVCFKCGSTEHRQFECKVQRDKEFRFATCFICKEPGHIARQCPDNPKGLYPNGGGCKLCGDVTHLRKDCPTVMDKKEEKSIKLSTLDTAENLEDIDYQKNPQPKASQESSKKPKKIKF